jgi:MFS transporter, DHA1 family, tetracycline resistance protein
MTKLEEPIEAVVEAESASGSGAGVGALAFILVTVVLAVMAGTMAFPVLPKLIESVSPGSAARTAELFGAFATVFAIMQFVGSPVQGALSDRFGRRPIIIASSFGMAVDFAIMGLAPNLGWLFAGRVISGALAGSITAASAYLVDITEPHERARMFGFFGAATGLGQAIGPAIGGLLASYGLRVPFWAAAAVSLLSTLYGLFVLPESLKRERRSVLHWRSANPVGAVLSLWRTYPRLVAWAAVTLLFALGGTGINSIFVLYTGYRYDWTPREIGLLMTGFGLGAMIVMAVVTPALAGRLGDRLTMLLGVALTVSGVVCGGLSRSGVGFSLATIGLCLGMITNPTQSAIITRLVGASDQGKLAGAQQSLLNIPAIIGPGVFTLIFAASIRAGGRAYSGVPLLLAAGAMMAAGLLAAYVTRERE